MSWEKEVAAVHAGLPVLPDIGAMGDFSRFRPLPEDWVLLTADVVGSTRHSAEGRYRDVNLIGAACVTACLNAVDHRPLPFFFGGDGALLACPASLAERLLAVVLGVAELAGRAFGFQLRVGGYPVVRLRTLGHGVRVARLRVTPELDQFLFEGGGVLEADRLLKAGDTGLAAGVAAIEPDLSGLECSWKEIPSKHGEIVSLLVWALPGQEGVYDRVMEEVGRVAGKGAERHPLRPELMQLAGGLDVQRSNQKLHHPGWPVPVRFLAGAWNAFRMRVAGPLKRFRPVLGGTDWGAYFDGVVAFSDSEKFSGMLALVFACSPGTRARLRDYLEREQAEGRLCYGLHVSAAALLTCMVFDRRYRHFHFIDGADGGYTMAAIQLKENRKAMEERGRQ